MKGSITIQHEALVRRAKLDSWTVTQCLNCDCFVYAAGEAADDKMLLVNANLVVSCNFAFPASK